MIAYTEYSRSRMESDGIKVTVQSRWPGGDDRAREISSNLGIPVSSGERVPTNELRIVLYEDGIQLWDEHSRRQGMKLDFNSIDLRTGSGGLSRKQPLARAIGRSSRSVLDATAGFGHDAFLLACLGWNVYAVERHPIIFMLLEESLQSTRRSLKTEKILCNRLKIHHQEAIQWLEDERNPKVDVIYMDPMFDEKPSSALPKKPAQILRRVVSRDPDAKELFMTAMKHASKRVVVKRSDNDDPLIKEPDLSYKGKIVRYDIYHTRDSGS